MNFGLFGINFGVCADPAVAARIARAAEAAGFDSLWTGEHIVLPDPQVPPSPLPPQAAMLDPAVALAFVAASTHRIRLATGIIILPQRNPVVLAKELASVDVVSGGRLIAGFGAGYLEPEFAALGIPFAGRGARTDEYIDAIRTLWTEPQPQFHGRFAAFANIDAQPRPIQLPHPPIVIGGHSPGAFLRAARRGNGWFGFNLTPDDTQRCIAGLRAAHARVNRPPALGELEISVHPRAALDRDGVRRLEDLGVHRLVVMRRAQSSADDLLRLIDATAALQDAR